MKLHSILASALTAVFLAAAGCASDKGQEAAKPADKRPIEQRLQVGMSKDEVRAACGEPAGKGVTSDGTESWRYTDSAKAWIPFYTISGGKFQTVTINFDKDGKVKEWSSNKQGMY